MLVAALQQTLSFWLFCTGTVGGLGTQTLGRESYFPGRARQ